MAVALATMATGCVQTSELPLAENVIMIRSAGISGGWIADMMVAEQVPKQTLRRAAQATVDRGYTHFRLSVVGLSTQQVGTTPVQGQIIGDQVMLHGGNPINRTTTDVIVTMYQAHDSQANGALEAHVVLAQGK